jgi:hypothetical protein
MKIIVKANKTSGGYNIYHRIRGHNSLQAVCPSANDPRRLRRWDRTVTRIDCYEGPYINEL